VAKPTHSDPSRNRTRALGDYFPSKCPCSLLFSNNFKQSPYSLPHGLGKALPLCLMCVPSDSR
jgi:hypothetical protein